MSEKISELKKTDYFRFPGKKKVYVYEGYNRSIKRYEYSDWDDISAFHSTKDKNKQVETNFEF